MKKSDIISIIQDNDISEYYSLKHLGIDGYAFPEQEALKNSSAMQTFIDSNLRW